MSSPEQIEASARYGNGIVRRIHTQVDISSIRAVMGKLRRISQQAEDLPGSDLRDGILHSVWKAMSWLPDSFSSGAKALLKEDRS